MKQKIIDLLAKHLKGKLKKGEIENLVEIPPNDEMGDYAFPCFALAKIEKKSPLLIAEELKKKLKLPKEISNTSAVAGYVNFFVDKSLLAERVLKVAGKSGYGKKKIKLTGMIEFSQPNTHKAFHVGHIRGTSIGESLARIAEFFGEKVIRANYSGDTGMHIAKWIWCYKKYHAKEKLRGDESWIAGIYVDAIKRLKEDEELKEEAEEINRKLDSKEDKNLNELWKKTRKLSIDSWKEIYKQLGTHFDKHYFESEVETKGKEIAKDLVRKKFAEISDGATIINLEKYGLSVWVLLRKDGTVLYSAKDLALAQKKFKDYKLDWCVYVHGSEQNLHFNQLFKVLGMIGFEKHKDLHHVGFDLVRLPHGKMSSRTGDNILYSDFIKEITDYAKKEISKRFKLSKKELEKRALAISMAAIKYSMLKQGINKSIIFNKEEAMSFEGDTGPYLLYSYARASSILRKVKSNKKVKIVDLKKQEIALLKKIAVFPQVVEKAYEDFAPNLIANYCYELASLFNEFYHNCPVLGSDEEGFRLKLVDCFRSVMKTSLVLLGIDVVEEM